LASALRKDSVLHTHSKWVAFNGNCGKCEEKQITKIERVRERETERERE